MRRPDLIGQLAGLAVDLETTLVPAPVTEQLGALCAAARLAFGAAAVSVAALDGEVLRYLGAAGAGADAIVGTELPVSRGIAGYVAVTGSALAIDRPAADPRFARDVAERTGYVPDALLVAPITAPNGEVAGVLTVLDRSPGDADALAMASAFAAQAWFVIRSTVTVTSTARVLLETIVDAAAAREPDIGDALRQSLATPACTGCGNRVRGERARCAARIDSAETGAGCRSDWRRHRAGQHDTEVTHL